MSEKTVTKKPASSTWDIQKVNPALSDKYSPNLFRYLKRLAKEGARPPIQFFRDKEGCIWLGHKDNFQKHGFRGGKLMHILTGITKKPELRSTHGNIKQDKTLWSQYVEKGRCTFDPNHTTHFLNSDSRYNFTLRKG